MECGCESLCCELAMETDDFDRLFSMTPRKRSILVDDAATAIAKSSKIALSLGTSLLISLTVSY